MGTRRRAWPVAALAAAAALLAPAAVAACGGTPSPAASASPARSRSPTPLATTAPRTVGTPAPAVPGIGAEAVRLRTDVAVGGQVQVRVTDTGDTPFTITSVAIDSPGFTRLPPAAQTATFAPGQVIDLPTRFGDVVCADAAQPAAALLTVTRDGGPPQQLRVPLAAATLDLVHTEECLVQAVEAVAGIAVTGLHEEGDAAVGTVRLTRTGPSPAPVTVTRLGRSVLVQPAAPLPATLAAGQAALAVPVSFTPASCDPHVLAETKQPFVFPLGVSVDGAADVPVDLPLDAGQRDVLAAMVQRVCGSQH